MTTTDKLIRLITAKRDMREALKEKGVETWGGLNIYPEAVDRIGEDMPIEVISSDVLFCEDGTRLRFYGSVPQIDVSKMTSMERMFYDNGVFREFEIDDVFTVNSLSWTFAQCLGLERVSIGKAEYVNNINGTFAGCKNLKYVYLPLSKVDDSKYTFQRCTSLINVDLGDFECDITDGMFLQCTSLQNTVPYVGKVSSSEMYKGCTSIIDIPSLNIDRVHLISTFENCTSLKSISNIIGQPKAFGRLYPAENSWIGGCSNIESIDEIDCSKCESLDCIFGNPGMGDEKYNLVNVGGFKDYGKLSYAYSLSLRMAPNLSKQSLLNILNLLFDLKQNGEKTLRISMTSNQLEKLQSSDIKIATDKGWILRQI